MDAGSTPSVRTALFTRAAYHIAEAIVGRDCRFGALAVCLVTAALMNEPARALVTGGALNILGGGILLARAWRLPRRRLQDFEVWRSMNDDLRIAPEDATPVLRNVLRATYLRFAGLAAWAGAWFFAMAAATGSYLAWRAV